MTGGMVRWWMAKHLGLAFEKHRACKSLQITSVTLDRIQVAPAAVAWHGLGSAEGFLVLL